MKTVYVIHSTSFDFKNELYEPLRNSSLKEKINLIFPHENSDKPYNSKELFLSKNKNLMILAEMSYDAKGRDMELGMAYIMNIPVVAIYKPGSQVSGSQKLAISNEIGYQSIEEIIEELEKILEL